MSKITAGPTESLEEQRFHQISTAVFFPGLVLMTYDAVERNTTSNSFPKLWNIIGTLSMLGALLWIVQVLRFNKFAARVVHVQAGQKLVTTGPYSVVRHPMYLGFGPAVFGFSLSVGSVWGLLPMGVCVLLIAHRTYGEERFLVETFGEAYQDYRTAVPYKMIPYVF
jgi:protein-S-isoprenylcysteine O-methyltransferase Ste14